MCPDNLERVWMNYNCTKCTNLKIDAIYALYTESFCDKNLAIRKVFAFCDSVPLWMISSRGIGRLAWVVVGDDPSFGPEAGDALNFGPTGRMGVPHLVHEQIFRNGFCETRRRAGGWKPCSACEKKEKTKSWEMWKSYKSQPSWDRIFIKKSICLMRGNNV